MEMNSHGPQALHYSHVATWVGSLQFASVTKDKDLATRLIARFEPFLAPDAPRVPRTNHVDAEVFGALPLELYMQSHRYQYRVMGLSFADAQWDNPTPDGLTNQTRWWIDDMYMITALQLQAYRATGEVKYRDRAALEMVAYNEKLQQPNGLYFHAPDVKFYWGRGDGWVAVGMAEMLRDLPEKHRLRKPILVAYRKMMATLLSHQAANGMWRQLIDHPESWEETSSTAMFTFAFVTGVKNGWLDEAHLRTRGAQGLDCAGGLSHAGGRPARSVRGHRQEERPAVLPRSPARRGRWPWPGADDVVGDGVAEITENKTSNV